MKMVHMGADITVRTVRKDFNGVKLTRTHDLGVAEGVKTLISTT
jgi:hypothetical protein